MTGTQSDSAIEAVERVVELAKAAQGHSAVGKGVGVGGIEFKGTVVADERCRFLVQVQQRVGPREMRWRVPGCDSDRTVEAGDGPHVLAECQQDDTAIGEGRG